MAITVAARAAQRRSAAEVAASRVIVPVGRACSTFLDAVDAFFRRDDSWLARCLARMSTASGASYSASMTKRALDIAVCVPLAILVILLIVLLLMTNKVLDPRRSALFFQDRVGHGDGLQRVVKIRSMVPTLGPAGACEITPRCTALGLFMRRHYLDELPQLFQVVAGQLSLVGIRILPKDVYGRLAVSWSHERFEAWRSVYATAPLGLTGVHQVFRRIGKEDERRFHRDMFYARHATLNFDLYLLWRTLDTVDCDHRRNSRRGKC